MERGRQLSLAQDPRIRNMLYNNTIPLKIVVECVSDICIQTAGKKVIFNVLPDNNIFTKELDKNRKWYDYVHGSFLISYFVLIV